MSLDTADVVREVLPQRVRKIVSLVLTPLTICIYVFNGGPPGDRTRDTVIKSHVLYH
jgi:hypothetical protein